MKIDIELISFWDWFLRGSGDKAGYRKLLNRWIFLHVVVGLLLSFLIPVDLGTAANSVLLPLVGILIALSFAWIGNAQALLQSEEIEVLSNYHKGGFEDYVYTFQLTILIILITIALWTIAGLEVFDKVWPTQSCNGYYIAVELILYAILSVTIRECWHVVLGSQFMLVLQRKIKVEIKKKKKE